MPQNDFNSYSARMRGSRRTWLAGVLSLIFVLLLWQQSYSFINTSPLPPASPQPNPPQSPPAQPLDSKPATSKAPRPTYPPSYTSPAEDGDDDFQLPSISTTSTTPTKSTQTEWIPAPVGQGDEKLLADAFPYVKAIMNQDDTTFSRLQCPKPLDGRYNYLSSASTQSKPPKYFFALNLHECADLLPSLLGPIIETIRFLGSSNCVLSIVEGRSTDGTFEILKLLQPALSEAGITYNFGTSEINPIGEDIDRIASLAELRNLVLRPLTSNAQLYPVDQYSTTVIFVNDVALCSEDLLELIHQRHAQNASMTCAMDWIFSGTSFYDVWVSRGMTGDQFFEIPQSGTWDFNGNLFWNDPTSKSRLEAKVPFQVFSCWNGAVAFDAAALLESSVHFRSKLEEECYLGEPLHFAKDLWYANFSRIAVVPSVNLGYASDQSLASKNHNGWTGETIKKQGESQRQGSEIQESEMIEWKDKPPELIKCVPSYQNPSWVRWDQALNTSS